MPLSTLSHAEFIVSEPCINLRCDLYDGGEKSYIPFDKLEAFFRENLK